MNYECAKLQFFLFRRQSSFLDELSLFSIVCPFSEEMQICFPTTCSFKCLTPVLLTVCLKIFLRCHIYFWGKVDGVKFEDEWSVRQSPGTG